MANRDFEFITNDSTDKQKNENVNEIAANLNLLRFAELDPRLVLANHDSTDNSPLDIHIEVTVTNILEIKVSQNILEEQ